MMKRRVLFSLCLLITASMLHAAVVEERQARQLAHDFLILNADRWANAEESSPDRPSLRMVMKSRRKAKTAASDASAHYYVYNIGEDKGFIIVSGDDRTPAILGYSTEGTLTDDSMPESMRYWLQGYADQIDWLDSHQLGEKKDGSSATADARASRITRTHVAPLLKTKWDQMAPYNGSCPLVTVNDIPTRTVTGCVATSMAQVMKYYEYPSGATTSIPAYTTGTLGIAIDELPEKFFDWDNMTFTYNAGSTDAEKTAVAELMQYCGSALRMNYNVSANRGSSAFNVTIAEAMKDYFGYSNTAECMSRKFYSYTEWVNIIYGEIAEGRPVVLGGQSAGGGHSFVCDGYDSDDFFHINWGWSGQSDGWFRLSALTPYEQGAGGSSTLDGFNYGQEAVIGLQPPVSPETKIRTVSLEGLQFGAEDYSSSKTFVRASREDDFGEVPFYIVLCSYRFGTNNYDLSILLKDADGNEVYSKTVLDNQSMTWNSDLRVSASFDLFAGVADGTYTLTLQAREHGEGGWLDCYQNDCFAMTAEISSTEMTLSPQRFVGNSLPTCSLLTVSDSPKLCSEVTVTATITGGSVDYRKTLYLYVNGKNVMGRQADIPAGETVDVRFSFIPSASGSTTIAVRADGTQIATTNVEVAESNATMGLTLGLSASISNISGGKLYGGGIRALLTLTNSSEDYDYSGIVNCSTRKYDGESFQSVNQKSYRVVVPKNGTRDIPIVVDDLTFGDIYALRFTYYTLDGAGKKILAGNDLLTARYEMADGYSVCLADTVTLHLINEPIEVGLGCRYVDLRNSSDPSEVTLTVGEANPNCLYLLNSGVETPTALSGKNVVKGDVAEMISIADGYDFFTPIDFTANEIDYRRTFTVAAAGTSGWNTITLPFAATSVTVGGEPKDWFRSSIDTGKHFWLRTYTGDGEGVVYFDFADELKANTPYIIAVPGDTWGSEWQLTGREMKFSATDAVVKASKESILSGDNYKFCGSSFTLNRENVYALNDAGSSFVKTASASIAPFRSWISAANISSLTLASLRIASGVPTKIVETQPKATDVLAPYSGEVFDLMGHKSNARSMLIVKDGKKIIKGRNIQENNKR